MDEATRNQVAAADPARSTWLTANAGSGKTRVLTDRVARLLLGGSAPERILCLTYTKAAATEMQNRLLSRLGQWAMLPDAALRAELARLGADGDAAVGSAGGALADLAAARRLFARAIEAPGGLKVQTIHSFCAALLRRFPLEAQVPMGFSELDDRSARALRATIVEEMAEAGDPVIADLVALHGGDDLDGFLAGLGGGDFDAPPDPDTIWRALDLPPGLTWDALLAQVFAGTEADLFAKLSLLLETSGSNDQKLAAALRQGNWDTPGPADLALLCDKLLFGKKTATPFGAKIGGIPAKALRGGAAAALMPDLEALMLRVQDARPQAMALDLALMSLSLHRFGHAFGRALVVRKAQQGWLDFDDLIARSADLLEDSSMAQWVLWRLDGGIDHILVDEAQDTSPDQWRVIRRLTEEFTSGAGAHDRPRTLFVVGDPKQSIYSFQGADIAVFEAMRDSFAGDFDAIGAPLQQRGLAHSFRSSPAILSLVDAVFQGEAAQGLGAPPRHLAFHPDLPGRIDIWPPVPAPDEPDETDWTRPVDAPAANAAETVLARAIARQIDAMLGTPIPDPRGAGPRPLGPGDIQILVQRRSTLFDDLIRELKAAGLPVAGADRLKLAGELAVRDIVATLTVLATPEDDLALASALRSPLFGLTEDDLYRLAAPRQGFLWQALRQSPHRKVQEVLNDLAGQTDVMRPHDLIARLLIRHGGRAALLARLGPEAEDGIGELLSQALAYETVEVPSLTGFLVWLGRDEVQIKRQVPGGANGLIRVMTVHGAKGLESPVVILPETQQRRADNRARTARHAGLRLWRGSADTRPPGLQQAVDDATRAQEEERRRLLYVAMTRAESWLIVAAAGKTGEALDSWHAMIFDGAARCGLTRTPLVADPNAEGEAGGLRLSFGEWPQVATLQTGVQDDQHPAIPDWARQMPARPTPASRAVAATSLGGAKALPGDGTQGDDDPQAAMLRGTRLHLLLEHLPGVDPADWPLHARAALAGAEGGLPDADELAGLLAEAAGVIGAEALAAVMDPGPDATVLREVALTATLPWAGLLHGTIDRLIVTPARILAIDYKSNAVVPGHPAETPDGILLQLAAYRAALRQIWPDRAIETAVLWTATRALMEMPDALLDDVVAALDPQALRP